MQENKNNKMAKMWLQDWVPMQNDELAITENVPYSPVTIGTNVGMDLVSYSGGTCLFLRCPMCDISFCYRPFEGFFFFL